MTEFETELTNKFITEDERIVLLTNPGLPGKPEGGGAASNPRRQYHCRFVRAGRVRSSGARPADLEITPAALQAAAEANLFTGKAVFIDHAGRLRASSLQRMVGVTVSADYNPHEGSVDGVLRLYDTPAGLAISRLLDGLLEDGDSAPDVGLSLVFWPQYADADPSAGAGAADTAGIRRVTGIRYIESIDLVFEPAADGRILQALSALAVGAYSDQGGPMTETEQSIDSTNRLGNSQPDPQAVTETASSTAAAEVQAWSQAVAVSAANAIIASSQLPQASRDRLSESSYRSPEDVKRAIEAERLYLAALYEQHVIQMGGSPPRSNRLTGMRTGVDQLSLALEALLAGGRPPEGVAPLTGIRELYHLLSGDYEMNGVFQGERIYLANVNSATMAGMVANALNKRVINEFHQYPQWWTPLVSEMDFSSLQQVKWITLGGVGELPTVAEGAAYTELTWDDQTESASFVKKGGYLGLTLEAIDKDDTTRLRAAPRSLAQGAWLTLSKSVSGIFTDNAGVGPTLSDSLALFHANHGNLGSTALSISSYAATRTAMRKMSEVNSGERLGALTAPKYLLVPPDLEITALQVLASQQDYTYALSNGTAAPDNPFAQGSEFEARMNAARQRVVVVDLWTDSNNWAAVADPRLYPTIGIGYRYGRAPELFSVASPTAGLMFTNDTMPVKVRFFYAVGPMDYRGLYKANV